MLSFRASSPCGNYLGSDGPIYLGLHVRASALPQVMAATTVWDWGSQAAKFSMLISEQCAIGHNYICAMIPYLWLRFSFLKYFWGCHITFSFIILLSLLNIRFHLSFLYLRALSVCGVNT